MSVTLALLTLGHDMTQQDCVQFDGSMGIDPDTGLLSVIVSPDEGFTIDPSLNIEPCNIATSFTPQLLVNGITITTQGNGTFQGYRTSIGNTVYLSAQFTLGSTSVFGASGSLTLILPDPAYLGAAPVDTASLTDFPVSGVVHMLDASTGNEYTYGPRGIRLGGGQFLIESHDYPSTLLTDTAPWGTGFSVGDIIGFCIMYRTA